MHWNYRVLKRYYKDNTGKRYYYVEVVEVYYDADGTARNFTEVELGAAENVEGLQERLSLMQEALTKPVLEPKGNELIETKKGGK